MKVFKLKGIEYYIVAFSIKDAVIIAWTNKWGITESNLSEMIGLKVDHDTIGKTFKSYEELKPYLI